MVLVLSSPSHTKQQFDDFYYSFSTVALMVKQGGKNGIPNIYQPQVLLIFITKTLLYLIFYLISKVFICILKP